MRTHSDNPEIILLGPINEPSREGGCCALIGLMHQRNMSIATCTSRCKLGLACGDRSTVPVLGVYVVCDDLVAQRFHNTNDTSTGLKVRRTHVRWLLAENIDERLLDFGHLGGEL